MVPSDGIIVVIVGIIIGILSYCCLCCCMKYKSTSSSDPLPSPQAPVGPVYFYDMTLATPSDDSAPPPYHLATLYPPVTSHQQMNPPVYAEVIYV